MVKTRQGQAPKSKESLPSMLVSANPSSVTLPIQQLICNLGMRCHSVAVVWRTECGQRCSWGMRSLQPNLAVSLRKLHGSFDALAGSLKGEGCTFVMQPTSSPWVVPFRNNSCLMDRVQPFSGV